jgi:hypothetical protein
MAYGGKVKKMQEMTAAAAGSMPTKEELALLAQQRAAAMAAMPAGAVPQRSVPGKCQTVK